MFYSWGNNKRDLGVLDARYCTNCGRHTVHNLLLHHRHFIFSLIPFYISNKYYSYCNECSHTVLIDKQYAKKMNKLNCKYFKTDVTLNAFIKKIGDIINENHVFDDDLNVVKSKVDEAKKIVYENFCLVHSGEYPMSFYNEIVDCLISEIEKNVESGKIAVRTMKQEIEKLPDSDSKTEVDELYEQLKKLKELLDQGILTEEEFNRKKQELLEKK